MKNVTSYLNPSELPYAYYRDIFRAMRRRGYRFFKKGRIIEVFSPQFNQVLSCSTIFELTMFLTGYDEGRKHFMEE